MCLTRASIAQQLQCSLYFVRPELGRYDAVDYVLIERSSSTLPPFEEQSI